MQSTLQMIFHCIYSIRGKILKHINSLVHTRSDEAEDSSIVSASGHLTPRVYLSSVHSTNGIAPVTRCTRSLTRYGRQSCPD